MSIGMIILANITGAAVAGAVGWGLVHVMTWLVWKG